MREMKDSGIKWIGVIPESWSISKIKHHFKIGSGTTPKSDDSDLWDGDIVWITPADFKTDDVFVSNGHRNLSQKGYENGSLELIPPGNIIFSKRAPVGQVVINLVDLCTNQGCLTAIPNDDSDVRYYRYLMSVSTEEFELASSGTTFKEISATNFGNVQFPQPDVVEQKTIADYLDNKCSKIDAIIEKQQAIIEKLKEYKVSIVTEAVTHGIKCKDKRKESTIGWIGSIPESWREYRVANLYKQTSESGNENLPFLTVSINTGISDRELEDDEQERVFVRSEDKSKYKRVQPGDLVYNMMRAWQGAFGAARVEGMVSPAYVTCRPLKENTIDTRYIEYLFRTPIAIEEMHRYSHGVADFRLRLYWPEFKNIRLCLPPYQEQIEIADYLDNKIKTIEKTIFDREKMIEKMEAYKKSLIYEVVTGKKEV
ncbi:restriction endonuclease subunit S [Lachnospiraceae bacterium C1.1]|nr:restriction endonuclease subunit S [Lachnospiraceae bacterium C1.1]